MEGVCKMRAGAAPSLTRSRILPEGADRRPPHLGTEAEGVGYSTSDARCSATRNAFAAMVSVGFVAAEDGKTLASAR